MDYLLNIIFYTINYLFVYDVLNLIINGLPSKQKKERSEEYTTKDTVLNLIINGLPSKH